MPGVFERLIGLETEYAIRFTPLDPAQTPPAKFRLYEALRAAIERKLPAVPAKHFKEGVFTANGGAVWFEAERPAAGGGLIEGATPECRTPKELLAYQRAQDKLLSECAADAALAGDFRLIKNDRDAQDNVYGAQENYEATLAEGLRLWAWRVGLVALFPLALITWAIILLSVLATLAYFSLAGLLYLPIRMATGGSRSMAMLLFGRDLVEGRETCVHVPVWLESTLQFATRLVTAPLAGGLYLLLRSFAFRQQRDEMLSFLVSRPVLAGAGMVDSNGDFQLADKAPAVNCLIGFGGMLYDRPLFTMGHFFKEIYAESWFSPRSYFSLFAERQRLQIALGDSNMCEVAEFLKIGATALVLDAAEAGAFTDADRQAPRLRRPIQALRAICADPTLQSRVELRRADPATALEIQQYYLERCRAFVSAQPDAPAEAWNILQLWEEVLDELQAEADRSDSFEGLVGVLDWVTKKYLLDHAGYDQEWESRKKIDICYHELSEDGYFRALADNELVTACLAAQEIDRAGRTPPPNSPAATRGRYIREFARSGTQVTANWKTVTLGTHWGARVIRIADYGRSGPSDPCEESPIGA